MVATLRRAVPYVAVLALFLPLLAACGDDDSSSDATASSVPAATTAPPPSTTTVPSSSTTEPETTDTVANVYWAWTVEPTTAESPQQLGAGGRTVSPASPAREAIEALLEGPDAIETEIGMSSEIPPETVLLDLAIADGVATVDLSGDFEAPGGTLGETLRVAQVVFTLTQFDTVDGVQFRIDGADVEVLGSHGLEAGEPLTRDDFTAVRPAILVEQPTPGAVVGDEVRLRGESNTFEATVVYTLTDGDGLIVAEGSTTATAGNGTWGEFDVRIPYDPESDGTGAVIVFEESAEDGSQINVAEYPVTIGST